MPPPVRRRDPDVAQLAGGLHREERLQVLLPRDEVVDLEEVEFRNAPALPRLLDLRGPAVAGGDPDLVGREDLFRCCRACARPYPMTSCEEPYIGEESIRRPPSRKNARITSAEALRAATSSPTLNVIELPSPTSGSRSPEDGIARVRIEPRWAEAVRGLRTEAAPAAPIETSSERRLILGMAYLVGSKRMEQSGSFRGSRRKKRRSPKAPPGFHEADGVVTCRSSRPACPCSFRSSTPSSRCRPRPRRSSSSRRPRGTRKPG